MSHKGMLLKLKNQFKPFFPFSSDGENKWFFFDGFQIKMEDLRFSE